MLCLHGYPESSRMWVGLMEALAAAGRRGVAPDLYGLGDSEPTRLPQTFETNLEALTGFVDELGLERVAICVHDWGGFVGLAWACDHPDSVEALVISDTGFFADGKWHGMAEAVRSEQGEQLVAGDRPRRLRRSAALLGRGRLQRRRHRRLLGSRSPTGAASGRRSSSTARWTSPSSPAGRASWASSGSRRCCSGAARTRSRRSPGAHRFEREIPDAKLVVIEGAGHFVFEERRERCVDEIAGFLAGRG